MVSCCSRWIKLHGGLEQRVEASSVSCWRKASKNEMGISADGRWIQAAYSSQGKTGGQGVPAASWNRFRWNIAVARRATVRTVLAVSVHHGYHIHQIDVKTDVPSRKTGRQPVYASAKINEGQTGHRLQASKSLYCGQTRGDFWVYLGANNGKKCYIYNNYNGLMVWFVE